MTCSNTVYGWTIIYSTGCPLISVSCFYNHSSVCFCIYIFHTSPNVYALNTKSMFISGLLPASKPSVNIYTPMRGTWAYLIPCITPDIIFHSILSTRWMIFKILYLHFIFTCLLPVCILSFKILLHSIHFSVYCLF